MIAACVALAFAYACPQDYRGRSPAYIWTAWTAFIVRTFSFHAGLVVLLSLLGALWRRWWGLAAVAGVFVAVTVGPAGWSYIPKAKRSISGESVTVMTVNLLMINQQTGPMLDEIKAAQPDILFIQEYTLDWHRALSSGLGDTFPHVRYAAREDSFGTALYSRRPFVGEVDRFLPLGSASTPQFRAVVEIAGRPVALYNIHLLPPWGLEYIAENRREFADLIDWLADEPLPIIMAGDFNFTEASPNAASLKRLGLADAHDLAGFGRGTTWPNMSFFRWIPTIRLDHIYLSGELTASTCRTGHGAGSDHRPVVAEVGFE